MEVRTSKHSLTNTLTIYCADGVGGEMVLQPTGLTGVDGIIVWWVYLSLAVGANYDTTNIAMVLCMQLTTAQLYPVTK